MRQRIGFSNIQVDLPENSTLADLRLALAKRHPEFENLLHYSMFAVGPDYVGGTFALADQMVVAWIPPVSGG